MGNNNNNNNQSIALGSTAPQRVMLALMAVTALHPQHPATNYKLNLMT
jgi:hypothetical protein